MRHWGGQHHAALPILPPGAEDASRRRHGYGRKSGAGIGPLVCNRETLPAAKLSLNIRSGSPFHAEGTVPAMIPLMHFKAAPLFFFLSD